MAQWFDDPAAPFRAREEGQELAKRWRRKLWWVGPALALLLGQLILGITSGWGFLSGPLTVIALGGFTLLAEQARQAAKREIDQAAARAMMENPWDARSWPVEIAVVQDGVPTGWDRGVAWFEGGRLGFSGKATSFVLTSEEVDPHHEATARDLRGLPDGKVDHALALRLPPEWRGRRRSVLLALHLLPRDADGQMMGEEGFAKRLLSLDGPSRAGGAPGQLPPLALGPDAPLIPLLRLHGWLNLTLLLLCTVAFVALLIAVVSSRKWDSAIYLAYFTPAHRFVQGFEKFRQVQVLRRLRAEESVFQGGTAVLDGAGGAG